MRPRAKTSVLGSDLGIATPVPKSDLRIREEDTQLHRYILPRGIEGEYQPGSRRRVLRNLLGLRAKTEIDAAENAAFGAVQERYYTDGFITAETRFTAEILKRMHEDWLGNIYAWAGEYRTVDMSKGDFVFPPAYLISTNMERFEKEVLAAHTPCRPRELSEVCHALAVVHGELLLIHPFREGNGRLARWVANLMAVQAGFPAPKYGLVGRGSKLAGQQYLGAVIRAYKGDYVELSDFFTRSLGRRLGG